MFFITSIETGSIVTMYREVAETNHVVRFRLDSVNRDDKELTVTNISTTDEEMGEETVGFDTLLENAEKAYRIEIERPK